ncbi:MAG: FimB/Mfa2 family fimbrial subunit, partial [Prevotella sp.]|nr:FimB/Mfa2 family fimbrial subunit [Prevotella sp.]
MKWTKILLSTLIFCLFSSFLSCEKPDFGLIGDDPIDVPEGFATLTFNITHFEQIPFDGNVDYARATDAGNVCTRINLAVFNDEGKVGTINQTIGDEDFGRISVAVPEGDCKIVILAHSGTGNATISKPDSIRFANNKVTDTFYYYAEMTADGESSHDVRLRRAVAKFQLATEDNVPENVAEIVFKYTGGSSAFDAKTGLGKINSRQTETRPVTAEMKGRPAEFDIYTFPHEQEDELK